MPRAAEVAVEAPVNIRYGSLPYAVMMATPLDLEDFVTGFSLSEGIVDEADEIRSIAVSATDEALSVEVDLTPDRLRLHLRRARSLTGRTSCGICGIEDSADLPMARTPVRPPSRPIAAAAIARAIADLRRHQPLNALTRSVHGAIWCDLEGRIEEAREDVGRHNALDKLIGAIARSGRDVAGGFVVVTSRASYEMVEKTAILGAGTLVSVSAPTSLAITRARATGLTLVSVAREDGCDVFTGKIAG